VFAPLEELRFPGGRRKVSKQVCAGRVGREGGDRKEGLGVAQKRKGAAEQHVLVRCGPAPGEESKASEAGKDVGVSVHNRCN